MLILEKIIKVKVNHRNRKHLESRLCKSLKNGDVIDIEQKDLPENTRIKVECSCDHCNKSFLRARVDINNRNNIFCSLNCRSDFKMQNEEKMDRLLLKCSFCNKSFERLESQNKNAHSLCSRECYAKHRSLIYRSDKIYNYQDDKTSCATCGAIFKTSAYYNSTRNNQFCSKECYWTHRQEHYSDCYYASNLNESRRETTPEKIVRKILENLNIEFEQEKGVLRKYYCDFYIPESHLIIEVFGDYWHVNPKIYDTKGNDFSKKPLNSYQSKFLDEKYDEIKILELESAGFNVLVLWENDIKNDQRFIVDEIYRHTTTT